MRDARLPRAVGRWSPQAAAIVAAIVIGDRVGLDSQVQRRLQEAGTYHVIAISGGNIAILAGLLLGAFRLAGLLGRTAMCAAIVALLAYGDLVGGGASVDRATLMAVVYFAGRALDLRSPPLNTLALVAGGIAGGRRSAVGCSIPAFVLTFGATLAILLVMPLVDPARSNAEKHSAASPGSAVSALIAVWPLCDVRRVSRGRGAAVSGRRDRVLARDICRVGAELSGDPVDGGRADRRDGRWCRWRVRVDARWRTPPAGSRTLARSASCGRRSWCGSRRGSPTASRRHPLGGDRLVYYCSALQPRVGAVAAAATRHGQRGDVQRAAPIRAGCARGVGAGVWILAEPWTLGASARGDGRLHATFLDVGQGDSAFVRFPRGATLLVDTGGLSGASAFDVGDRVVAPVLREAGVRRLTYVALTHGDPDHIGGAASVLREFRPREVWEGIPVPRFEPLRALRDEAHELGLKWANVTAGDRIVVGGVEIAVRHPAAADWERQDVRNDDSIVLELLWRGVSIVLTGDIGKDVERTLARPDSAGAAAGHQGAASRQPHVEHACLRAIDCADGRRLQRGTWKSFRASGA